MGVFVYIFHGVGLLLSLLIPGRRRETLARWKKTRPHKLVFEIGAGLTGLIMVGAILWLIVIQILSLTP